MRCSGGPLILDDARARVRGLSPESVIADQGDLKHDRRVAARSDKTASNDLGDFQSAAIVPIL